MKQGSPWSRSLVTLFVVLWDSGYVAHVAVTTTLPVLDCLSSAWQHLQHKCLEKHSSPSKKKRTGNNIEKHSYLLASLRDTCTTLPSHPSSILFRPIRDGRKRQNAATMGNCQQVKDKIGITASHCRRTRQICNVRKLATECHKLNSLRLHSIPTEKDDIREK